MLRFFDPQTDDFAVAVDELLGREFQEIVSGAVGLSVEVVVGKLAHLLFVLFP